MRFYLPLLFRISKIKAEENTALKVNIDVISALNELCMIRLWNEPEYSSCVKTADNHFQIDCSLRGYTVKGMVGLLYIYICSLSFYVYSQIVM
jgi:hypothetical protein